nr:replication protein A 70 kDa DNA-binding subunit B-like [Ipomoea batatas]
MFEQTDVETERQRRRVPTPSTATSRSCSDGGLSRAQRSALFLRSSSCGSGKGGARRGRIEQNSGVLDLIGRVVSIHQPKDIQVKQNSQRLIDFVIEDCRESRLAVTLWDEHVDSVLPYFNGGLTDPLIVIVQLCRARVTDGG